MKKLQFFQLVFFAVFFVSGSVHAQILKDFFNNSEYPTVYLGIDFSKAKLINDPMANTIDIKNRLYGSINDVTVYEAKKYDIGKAFHKSMVSSDLSGVKKRIEKINSEDILSQNSDDFSRLKESDIHAVVKGLDLGKQKEGVGVLFVMEAMRKMEKNNGAAVWLVLIDMHSKKVLLTKRYEEKAAGFGFRNMWVSPIKATLNDIEKNYSNLKKEYGE
ncbi:MAG: hypothetical protein IT254_01270 [Chitinophagaceae bacterium]|nr:hypothetical protein [Bacteroidota bacterium]MCC6256931.1 hypothetical protein [Chitinophagaceae bacterium]MCW5916004.1 hypothetical protein [Ferruginibacter sp.]